MKQKFAVLGILAVIGLIGTTVLKSPVGNHLGASIFDLGAMKNIRLQPGLVAQDPVTVLISSDTTTPAAPTAPSVVEVVSKSVIEPQPATQATFFQRIANTVTAIEGLVVKPVVQLSVPPHAIGGKETLEGVFVHTHFDNFNTGKETPIYTLMTSNGSVSIDPGSAARIGDIETYEGATIKITGYRKNGVFSVTSPDVALIKAASKSTRSSRSTGPIKISMVLYKFAGDTSTPPFTKDDVRKNFFEPNTDSGLTMSQFLEQSTYGRVTLTGKTSTNGSTDVYGWYTVSQTKKCSDTGNYVNAGAEAIRMAMNNGLQLGPDDIVIAGTYPGGCPTGGSGSMIPTTGNLSDLQNTAIPRVRMISMSDMVSWGNTLHEFGHMVGTSRTSSSGRVVFNGSAHSNSLDCKDQDGSKIIFGTLLNESDCIQTEYGGPFSVMGGYASGAQKTRRFDEWNLFELGDLNSSNYLVADVSGAYDLTKINYSDATILRIPITFGKGEINGVSNGVSTSGYIDLEARDFLPFEQAQDTAPHVNIVTAHRSDYILDISTGINSKILPPGQIADLSDLGISIQNLGPVPGNQKKIRVMVSYAKPLPERVIPGPSVKITSSPRLVIIHPDGSFIQPVTHVKTEYYSGTKLVLFPYGGGFVYPQSAADASALPVYGTIIKWLGTLNNSDLFYTSTEASLSPLKDLAIDPATLSGHPRFIYKISAKVYPPGTVVDTYLIYGEFTTQELVDLGVINRPISSYSSQELIDLGIKAAPALTPLKPTTTTTPVVKSSVVAPGLGL